MGKFRTEKEKRLQRKLIPLNLIICIISLVAALSLFILPILNVDAGKVLHDEGVMGFVDEKIDEKIKDSLEGSGQEGVDYTPVVAMLVKNILGNAEGEISVSAYSSFRVLIGSGDKTQTVLDDLFFGENALATRLINSVVDGVANLFETEEGRALFEEALVSTMTQELIKGVDDQAVANVLTTENVKQLVGIMKGLGDPEKVQGGDVGAVADEFIDKVDEILGAEINIDETDKEAITAEIQSIYDCTVSNLKEGESVSMEAIICVTLSEKFDLSQINIEKIFDVIGSMGGDDSPAAAAEEEVGGGKTENEIVTNYDDLLLKIGYDEEKKEELKEKMRTSLNEALNNVIEQNGIKDFMSYYEYIFLAMLAFIGPWLILFLFSFFHMFAKNKKFTMWYVKLICFIPPLIWLALKLLPIVAPKVPVLNDMWNGEHGVLVQGLVSGTSTYAWISGICYLLLWVLSIFWAFPIKRKIRKERKYPEVEDAEDDYEY